MHEVVRKQPPDQGTAAVHLQLTRRVSFHRSRTSHHPTNTDPTTGHLARTPPGAASAEATVKRICACVPIIELLHEGIPLPLIQRQLGHAYLSTTGTYLEGISSEEIIGAMHGRKAPMMHVCRARTLMRGHSVRERFGAPARPSRSYRIAKGKAGAHRRWSSIPQKSAWQDAEFPGKHEPPAA